MIIPIWLKNDLKYFKCTCCKKNMQTCGIVGIGVHLGIKSQKDTVFFFQYKCPHCKQRTNVQLDIMDSLQLAKELAGETMETNQGQKKSIKYNETKSSIDDKQIQSLKKFMTVQSDYVETLKFLGLSSSQIQKYTK